MPMLMRPRLGTASERIDMSNKKPFFRNGGGVPKTPIGDEEITVVEIPIQDRMTLIIQDPLKPLTHSRISDEEITVIEVVPNLATRMKKAIEAVRNEIRRRKTVEAFRAEFKHCIYKD
jgi:hypothetical protein